MEDLRVKKQITIFLCDDDPVDRKLVKSYLAKSDWYDFLVIDAGEEEEILPLINNNHIDLILLDIQMPGKSGLDWLEEFNQKKIAPVVILTGYGSEVIAVDAMKAGAYDYLPKSQLSTSSLVRAITNSMEKWQLEKQLDEYKQQLELLARTDGLTGLMNRRYTMERLDVEIRRAIRYKRPLSIFLIDLDKFKQVNDTFGHVSADKALIELIRIIRESVRSVDLIGRYGGDEFVVILPETKLEDAWLIGERVRQNVAQAQLYREKEFDIQITLSLGIACLEAREYKAEILDQLLSQADKAMYAAKHQGGNRVMSFEKNKQLTEMA